jgi:hypothetical protein
MLPRIPSMPRFTPHVLPVLVGLALLALVPAAQAAETLVLTCHVCTKVVATGKGLPADTTVQVTLTDVQTGLQVVSPVAVRTDAQGACVKTIPVDLSKHPSVESSVWTPNSGVLVVAAHNRFTAPCHNGMMGSMSGMGGMPDHLAFTGIPTLQLLGIGFGLLAAGIALRVVGRRRPRRA